MKKLSPSMQNYIKAIYELSSGGGGVRCCDIADKTGVSKASVCNAVKNLECQGLIYRDVNRLVYLSKKGSTQRELYLNKAAIIRRFLCDILLIDRTIADSDAYALESVISMDTLCALCRFTSQCKEACRIKSGFKAAPDKNTLP